MEISKIEKEELGNFIAACEQSGLLQCSTEPAKPPPGP
jgi:hypothetical protein